jgi:type II secretory pathway component GspD/PulD (secretin)
MKFNDERKGRKAMNRTIGVMGMALVLACGSGQLLAQGEAKAEKANEATTETAPKTYRLTYTITHLDGTKQMGVQHYALTVTSDNRPSWFRLGSRVPIATGGVSEHGATTPGQVQYQYVDVGLNISARIREFSTGLQVFSRVEQSSLADEPSGVGSSDPVIRQGTLENSALLTLGKPVMLGSLDVPGSSMHMDIEVVLEMVK